MGVVLMARGPFNFEVGAAAFEELPIPPPSAGKSTRSSGVRRPRNISAPTKRA